MASSTRRVPMASVSAVYSGSSKETADVTLRREVVDLVRLDALNDAYQAAGIGHVSVVEEEAASLVVRVLVEMIDAIGVEQGAAALDAVDFIAFGEQQLGEIRSILPGDTGDQSLLHSLLPLPGTLGLPIAIVLTIDHRQKAYQLPGKGRNMYVG